MISLFTIGFTKKSAEKFFKLLDSAKVRTILDTRLNNSGQLAGFSKKEDLEFFARRLINADYFHWTDAAPTEEMLKRYKRGEISWAEYESEYRELIKFRRVEESIFARNLDGACLLCSEERPHHCHRRVLAEYLAQNLPVEIKVAHL